MSPAIKAGFVICGLMGFCGIAVLGPSLEGGVGTAVQTAFGATNATAVKNHKLKANKDYATGGPLSRAIDCCKQCDAEWNFEGDRCELYSQTSTTCYASCGK